MPDNLSSDALINLLTKLLTGILTSCDTLGHSVMKMRLVVMQVAVMMISTAISLIKIQMMVQLPLTTSVKQSLLSLPRSLLKGGLR